MKNAMYSDCQKCGGKKCMKRWDYDRVKVKEQCMFCSDIVEHHGPVFDRYVKYKSKQVTDFWVK